MSLEDQIENYLRRFKKRLLKKPERCAVCGRAGHLHWHAAYHRSLITFQDTLSLPVRRILCGVCRRTFALLPDFVIKYRRYAKAVIRFALHKLFSHFYEAVADLLMEHGGLNLAVQTLYLWRRRLVRSPS